MTLLPIFLSILCGIAAGYLLRQKKIVGSTGRMIHIVIMLLLLFLGFSVGNNEQVVTRFLAIGMEALWLTLGGTLGSLFAARLLYRRLFLRSQESSHQQGLSKRGER